MKFIIKLLGLCLLVLCSLELKAQDEPTFEITKAIANEDLGQIELLVKAWQSNGLDLLSKDISLLKASMQKEKGVEYPLDILTIDNINYGEETVEQKESPMKVLFLLDLSGSMRGEKLRQAKKAIKEVLDSEILNGSDVQFAWFHDWASKSMPVSKYNYSARVDVVDVGPKGKDKDTDLYRTIKVKTEELSQIQGQKVIILLTDGKNDIGRNRLYKGKNALKRLSMEEVLTHVSQYDSTLQIFPVGVGGKANKSFLKKLTESTKNPKDYYSFGVAPKDVSRTFISISRAIAKPNFKIYLLPNYNDAVYCVEDRTVTLNYIQPLAIASKTTVFGSNTKCIDLRSPDEQGNALTTFLTGILLLGLLLAILYFSVPLYNNQQFKSKYIKKYKELRQDNRTKKDPLTLEEFQDEDDVVVNGLKNKMLKLSTWKYYNENNLDAGEYQELFQLQTKPGNFFNQQGVFKKLNWLWFGALGGFLSWIFSFFLAQLNWDWYLLLLESLDGETQISSSIFNETLVGVAMGASIVGTLAFVEERGQSRKFNIGRIGIRILIGIIAGLFIFFIESALVVKFIPFYFLRQLIGWTLFGTAMGIVITLFSSIEIQSGVKGGFFASICAFLLYFLLNLPFMDGVFPTKIKEIISFISYGGILGYLLFTVVKQLESYELRCLSPSKFSGWQSPISKWLKSPSIDYIIIGKNPKSRVYIKWDDINVKPNHARLLMIKGVPHIEPDEGQVLVNNRAINKATPLDNEARIKLGENSISILQFLSKEKNLTTTRTNGLTINPKKDILFKRRTPNQVQKIRNQIKINRK